MKKKKDTRSKHIYNFPHNFSEKTALKLLYVLQIKNRKKKFVPDTTFECSV